MLKKLPYCAFEHCFKSSYIICHSDYLLKTSDLILCICMRSVTKIKPLLTSDLFDTLKNQRPLIQASVLAVAPLVSYQQKTSCCVNPSLTSIHPHSFPHQIVLKIMIAETWHMPADNFTVCRCPPITDRSMLTIQAFQTGTIIIKISQLHLHRNKPSSITYTHERWYRMEDCRGMSFSHLSITISPSQLINLPDVDSSRWLHLKDLNLQVHFFHLQEMVHRGIHLRECIVLLFHICNQLW